MEKPTLASIARDLRDMSDRIGRESEDGKGGTGLTGRMIRAEQGIGTYKRDRNMIVGGLATIAATSLLLILGFKAWVASWFPGA